MCTSTPAVSCLVHSSGTSLFDPSMNESEPAPRQQLGLGERHIRERVSYSMCGTSTFMNVYHQSMNALTERDMSGETGRHLAVDANVSS